MHQQALAGLAAPLDPSSQVQGGRQLGEVEDDQPRQSNRCHLRQEIVLFLVEGPGGEIGLEYELLPGARSGKGVDLNQLLLNQPPVELVLGTFQGADLGHARVAGTQEGRSLRERVDAADQLRLVGVEHSAGHVPDLDSHDRPVADPWADDGVDPSECGLVARYHSGSRLRSHEVDREVSPVLGGGFQGAVLGDVAEQDHGGDGDQHE